MSHEFYIRAKGADIKTAGYFAGLANGLLYEAFGMKYHFMGVSGDNVPEIISREKAIEGLDKALAKWPDLHYPDPKRIDHLRHFRTQCDNEYKEVREFEVCFF